jgi:filamentous hemagglutinin
VYSSLRRNVNAAADFERYQHGGVELSSADIDSRIVRVAVPRETTSEQWVQIMRAIRYAEERNVRLIPEVVTNSSR